VREFLRIHDPGQCAIRSQDGAAGLASIEEALQHWLEDEGWESMFAESWGKSDDQVLVDPATLAAMKTLIRESVRQGTAGLWPTRSRCSCHGASR
jgi:hypothetical protein